MKRSLACFLVVALAACGDDDKATTYDARPQGTADAGVADAGSPDANTAVARGAYLVNTVMLCIDCHTPRNADGSFDMTKHLSGVECLVDVDPNNPNVGCLSSRNLTNHATGLMTRTDEQIKNMFMNGVRPDGKFLSDVMPYWLNHHMTDADANAIVAYLRTVPGVDHTVPAQQPPFANVPAATAPIMDSEMTSVTATAAGTTQASADRGKYLAYFACVDCHSPLNPPGSARPVDLTKAFSGGRDFDIGPPFGVVTTRNLTPHASGLMGYTVADIVRVLREGKDKDMKGVCPPMPSAGPGTLRNITEADATDLANYILNLPAIDAVHPLCSIP